MRDKIFLLAPISTLALAVAFLAPGGLGSKTVYEPVTGKAWSMRQPEPAAVQSAPTVAVSSTPIAATAPPTPAPIARPTKPRAPRHHHSAPAVAAARPAPIQTPAAASALAVSTATVAPVQATPRAVPSSPPDYALEDIADRFENDESKFPLDRSTEAEGMTLRLVGLEKLPAMYVLKIAVVNSTPMDFFVKAFSVVAGGQILSSRPIFRILVEPQRTREGYVLFERPQAGASVKIILKEDGGKNRSLETGIPYAF